MEKGTRSNPLSKDVNSTYFLTREGGSNILRGVSSPVADNDATPKAWVTAQINAAIAGESIVDITVADLQSLADKGSAVWYRITDAAFQGSTQALILRSTNDGDGMESEGYLHIGAVVYPCSYDLTSNLVLSFYDHIYNNRISRTLGGGKNCVDNFIVGYNGFTNTIGHDFDISTAQGVTVHRSYISPGSTIAMGATSGIDGCNIGQASSVTLDVASVLYRTNIGQQTFVTINDGGLMQWNNIGETSTVGISGAGCVMQKTDIGSDTTVTGTAGAGVTKCTFKNGVAVTLASGANITNSTIGNGTTFNVNGASHDNLVVGEGSLVVGVNNASYNSTNIGNSSFVTLNGPAGGGNVVFIRSSEIGNESVVTIGNTAGSGTRVTGTKIGNFVTADIGITATVDTQLFYCEIGDGKTFSLSDGSVNTSYRYVNGFSNWPGTLAIALGDGIATIVYDNLAGGPFTVGEIVTNGTTAATGVVVSDDGTTLILKNIVQLPTTVALNIKVLGAKPFNNNEALTGGTSGATADVNGTPTYGSFTLPVGGNHVGIWNITSSNANETIDKIFQFTLVGAEHPLEFRPSSSLNLKFVSSASATAGANELVLTAPVGIFLNGDNADNCTMRSMGFSYAHQVGIANNYA